VSRSTTQSADAAVISRVTLLAISRCILNIKKVRDALRIECLKLCFCRAQAGHRNSDNKPWFAERAAQGSVASEQTGAWIVLSFPRRSLFVGYCCSGRQKTERSQEKGLRRRGLRNRRFDPHKPWLSTRKPETTFELPVGNLLRGAKPPE
jgi:hypothetical protein